MIPSGIESFPRDIKASYAALKMAQLALISSETQFSDISLHLRIASWYCKAKCLWGVTELGSNSLSYIYNFKHLFNRSSKSRFRVDNSCVLSHVKGSLFLINNNNINYHNSKNDIIIHNNKLSYVPPGTIETEP